MKTNYAWVDDVLTPEEKQEFFRKSLSKPPAPWTPSDIRYLREWYGRDDTLLLAYALERTPWSLAQMAVTEGLRKKKG